jgi:hypothetical protein
MTVCLNSIDYTRKIPRETGFSFIQRFIIPVIDREYCVLQISNAIYSFINPTMAHNPPVHFDRHHSGLISR